MRCYRKRVSLNELWPVYLGQRAGHAGTLLRALRAGGDGEGHLRKRGGGRREGRYCENGFPVDEALQ